jgi:hypothetical protein
VNGAEQPTLIVNDVKSRPGARGAVALWLGPGTVAHFRSLEVRPSRTPRQPTRSLCSIANIRSIEYTCRP